MMYDRLTKGHWKIHIFWSQGSTQTQANEQTIEDGCRPAKHDKIKNSSIDNFWNWAF